MMPTIAGTFGQRVPWHVEDETTYRHPDLPSDVDELLRPPDQVVKKKVEDTDDVSNYCVILCLSLSIGRDGGEGGGGRRRIHKKMTCWN